MKKIIAFLAIAVLVVIAVLAWKILGPGTAFEGKNYYLLIKTGSNYQDVTDSLEKNGVFNSPWVFNQVAQRLDYPQKVKAGRYNIKSGMSLLNIVRMLRNGQQDPVKLVIIKFRTKEDIASVVGRKFECDSLSFINFLNDPDSMKHYGLDTNTVMTTVFPDTYTYFWNTTPGKIFAKFRTRYQAFWTPGRRKEATAHGLNPQTAYILASIVEEETNASGDKGKIASVYLNRLSTGMKLAADPTVKYAMRNFGLKRIYEKYTKTESPYNTYLNTGLPPGPICTPSAETIDAVLNAPGTKYLYFVAKPDFSGYSNFSENYQEHMKFAKEYQQFLDKLAEQKATGK
ncbi:MAG TPA: endolytic transglycosylase MltG [Chitinophagaceae bacterium]|jgi:UPF0755 protein